MAIASNPDSFVGSDDPDQRMRAVEKRVSRLHVLTQSIGVSVVSALIFVKP